MTPPAPQQSPAITPGPATSQVVSLGRERNRLHRLNKPPPSDGHEPLKEEQPESAHSPARAAE
jgi:hypothetical protein